MASSISLRQSAKDPSSKVNGRQSMQSMPGESREAAFVVDIACDSV